MRQLLLILAASTFMLSTSSFADHNGGGYNFAAAADLAYRLADIGESYASSYDYQLSSTANALHYAASDLYRALRNQGGFRYMDHNAGGGIEVIHQMVNQVGYRVDNFEQMAPWGVGSRARSLYVSIRNYLGCK